MFSATNSPNMRRRKKMKIPEMLVQINQIPLESKKQSKKKEEKGKSKKYTTVGQAARANDLEEMRLLIAEGVLLYSLILL